MTTDYLHHEDGTHRATASTAAGHVLENHESAMARHLADGHTHEAPRDEQGYNGWANYETWATSLHIDNEQGTYEEVRRIVAEAIDLAAADEEELHTSYVADMIKDWVEELYIDPVLDDHGASLAADLLRAAFGAVDWMAIAAGILAEVREEAAANA